MRRSALLLLLALAGCDEPRSEAYSAEDEADFKPVSAEVRQSEAAQKIDGIAILLGPDAITQLNAEIRAAQIAAAFSERTVARFRGTQSLGAHRLDNAERQAATDATQVALLELKLRNAWGEKAPFLAAANRQQLVDELSSGKTTLVRLDFPRSVELDPRNVQITPLGGGGALSIATVWPAPSGNLAMPGTSFFGIMPTGPGLRPGDRAKITAERSTPTAGVIVPAAAIVVHAGASWCYVEKKPGDFERRAITLATPVPDGYLTAELPAGAKVVVQGASALLAREADPDTFDDDDDGGDDDDRPQRRKLKPPKFETEEHERSPADKPIAATSDTDPD